MSRFLSGKFDKLKPYIPGEQPQDRKYIKLNTNESPYPPSPKVLEALSTSECLRLNLYSDPTAGMLINEIAKYYSVKPQNVFVGNGSDEVLAFAFYAFCDSNCGRGMSFPDITYGFYPVYCNMYEIEYEQINLDENFSIKTEDYLSQSKNNVIIANPNAQTGVYLDICEVERIVAHSFDRVVIIDEAYIDFGGVSAVSLTEKYDNLIVIGTLSKSRSLAGGRVGYAIASEKIIADLNTMKYSFNPYNINRLSIVAGAAAFADVEYFKSVTKSVIKNREYLSCELVKRGFKMPKSSANFVLTKTDEVSGKELYEKLRQRGILVRHFSDTRISDYVRITIGSREQIDALLCAIDDIFKELKSKREEKTQ